MNSKVKKGIRHRTFGVTFICLSYTYLEDLTSSFFILFARLSIDIVPLTFMSTETLRISSNLTVAAEWKMMLTCSHNTQFSSYIVDRRTATKVHLCILVAIAKVCMCRKTFHACRLKPANRALHTTGALWIDARRSLLLTATLKLNETFFHPQILSKRERLLKLWRFPR